MELKPCPFCGGEAKAIEFSAPRTFGEGNQAARPKVWVVRCIKNSCGTLNTFYYDKKLAIDLWNTRAERTCRMTVIDTGNEAAYEHYEYIMHCEKCHQEFGYVQYNEDGGTWQDERPSFCPNCGAKVVES